MFLESFRLPGEAQKIARVLEAFGQEYHKQCPHIFYNSDVVYVLSYSVIMLNTDQHNTQASPRSAPVSARTPHCQHLSPTEALKLSALKPH